VNLDIDDSTPFDGVVQGLRNHLLANRLMYSRGTITVNVGRRMLVKEELTRIRQLIEKESGVTVSRFWCPPQVLEEALSQDLGFGVAISPREKRPRPEPDRPEIAHNDPRLFRKPQTTPTAGPAGLELWAPYIKEVSPRIVEFNPAANEDAAGQEPAAPPGGPPTGDQVALDEAARETAEAAAAAISESQEGKALVEVRDPRAKPKESSKGGDASKGATFETRWEEVGKAEAAPARRKPGAGEPSGLNRGNEALLIKTHCRSGEVIRYPGDVVVMADVNPGSEIIADGDILVFGSLRGFAHAGAGGDIQATIIAQNFETPRLQIGPHVGIDPKPRKRSRSNSSNPSNSNPRMAYVRRRSVYVAPYTGRFGEYSGGTLYDG
jgi:septum site-determining protein MinC